MTARYRLRSGKRKRDRAVGNKARRPGQPGSARDGFEQVNRRIGHPQLRGVIAWLEMVGKLHLVWLPEADASALTIDQYLEGVIPHFWLGDDPLVLEIGGQLEPSR